MMGTFFAGAARLHNCSSDVDSPGRIRPVAEVECEIVRWVAAEPQPGLVEAVLIDMDGKRWSFIQKDVYFTTEPVLPSSAFPIAGAFPCEVVSVGEDGVVTVDTGDFESEDGVSQLRVPASSITGT
jgi:hypothetical protein